MFETILLLLSSIVFIVGIFVLTHVYQKDLDKKDKEINKLKSRIECLNDSNIKILTLNDELLKEKQDLILTISLLKDEKENSKQVHISDEN